MQAACGWNHTLLLHSDGTVTSFGQNTYGQLGRNGTSNDNRAIKISGLSGVNQISANKNSSVALKITSSDIYPFSGSSALPRHTVESRRADKISTANRLIVKQDGNVGIGTTSPTKKLDVRGNVRIGDGETIKQDIEFISNVGNWQVGTNNSGNNTTDNNRILSGP